MNHSPESGELEIREILNDKRRYFWDKGPLNPETDSHIIIERILEFGTEEEVGSILRYFGADAVSKVVRESRALSPKTVNYFALLFGFSKAETKCFSDVSPKI